VGVGLVVGLTIGMLVYALGHISGGHFNPAVTVSLALIKRFPADLVIPYVAAQLLGSIAAIGLLKEAFFNVKEAMDAMKVTMGSIISPVQAFGIEVFATFVFVLVIVSVTTDKKSNVTNPGLPIGLALAIMTMLAAPLSGGALNPARAFGPAVWTQDWATQWIYWVGPIVGATIAAVLYEFLRTGTPPTMKKKLI
ncbi:aquaporin, partial [Patescibacteria group bacterium]